MPPRIVRTTVEIEGRMSDELALVEGKDLKGWARDTTIVGARTPRIDGAQRVTGRARYTQDVVLPGMLHARFLRSPHARAGGSRRREQGAHRAGRPRGASSLQRAEGRLPR